MWLNTMILCFASLTVGFLLGWIVALPKRWDYVSDTITVPAADDPTISLELTR